MVLSAYRPGLGTDGTPGRALGGAPRGAPGGPPVGAASPSRPTSQTGTPAQRLHQPPRLGPQPRRLLGFGDLGQRGQRRRHPHREPQLLAQPQRVVEALAGPHPVPAGQRERGQMPPGVGGEQGVAAAPTRRRGNAGRRSRRPSGRAAGSPRPARGGSPAAVAPRRPAAAGRRSGRARPAPRPAGRAGRARCPDRPGSPRAQEAPARCSVLVTPASASRSAVSATSQWSAVNRHCSMRSSARQRAGPGSRSAAGKSSSAASCQQARERSRQTVPLVISSKWPTVPGCSPPPCGGTPGGPPRPRSALPRRPCVPPLSGAVPCSDNATSLCAMPRRPWLPWPQFNTGASLCTRSRARRISAPGAEVS